LNKQLPFLLPLYRGALEDRYLAVTLEYLFLSNRKFFPPRRVGNAIAEHLFSPPLTIHQYPLFEKIRLVVRCFDHECISISN